MGNQVLVPKDRRGLKPGFVWQQYVVHMVRPMTPQEISLFGNEFHAQREKWEQAVSQYIHARSRELGMEVQGVVAHFLEEPNESKMVEVAYWKSSGAACIWTVFGILLGAVEEKLQIQGRPLPLFGFWPREINSPYGIPEMFDARLLTAKEQAS